MGPHEQMNAIFDRLGSIDAKLADLPEKISDHEKRISKVEFRVWVIWGALFGICCIAYGAVNTALSKFIGGPS